MKHIHRPDQGKLADLLVWRQEFLAPRECDPYTMCTLSLTLTGKCCKLWRVFLLH